MNSVLHNIRAVLIDLSGTLHVDNFAIKGSQKALEKLKKSGLKVKFVTNTSKENVQAICERLQSLNFNLSKDEIYSSLSASKHLVLSSGLRPFLMLTDSAKQDFLDVDTDDPNAIVVGLSPKHFQHEDMTLALRLLLEGAKLIAINKARYYKRPDGLAIGAGALVSALEFASGVDSVVVGKPEKQFFSGAAALVGCKPEECLMIGDDYLDDVEGAMKAGMKGLLVQTGKYRKGDELKISLPGFMTAKDFSEAVELILKR